MEYLEDNDFTSVVDNLVSMFGNALSKEVISTVVESCEGDLNLSMDAIMNLTNDGNIMLPKENEDTSIKENSNLTEPAQQSQGPSYAAQCAQSRGAIPKKIKDTKSPAPIYWTDQFRQIITHHNMGTRIIIFMRGLPGSGKSYLALSLVESMVSTNPKHHIFCTDDYFMCRGQYKFDQRNLSFAHSWNQERVKYACEQGLSPIIVDNTNIVPWEMQPYLIEGIKNGYVIEVIEMNTPWAKKAHQLFKKNKHGVPFGTIKKKLEMYTEGITGESLIHTYRLSYPSNMIPPVKRLLPPLNEDKIDTQEPTISLHSQLNKIDSSDNNMPNSDFQHSPKLVDKIQTQIANVTIQPNQSMDEVQATNSFVEPLLCSNEENESVSNSNVIDDLTQEELAKQKFVLEAQKRLEEISKFEEEWENGEKWDEQASVSTTTVLEDNNKIDTNTATNSIIVTSSTDSVDNTLACPLIANLESKPPRKEKNVIVQDYKSESLIQPVNDHQDWRSILMPPWATPDEQSYMPPKEKIFIETISSGTCVEINDTSLSGNHKIVTATSRDINEFYVAPEREKIPEKRMFDKSTMTNDDILMSFFCPQKEKHFVVFRKLFKHIERESLRDIFDNCCGDANWAVESILGGGVNYTLKNSDDKESDLEEEFDSSDGLSCTCLAKYNIMPDIHEADPQQVNEKEKAQEAPACNLPRNEKKKRDVSSSDENIKLKRQIEQNVVIPDSHYSEHCLKIRKLRRGEPTNTDLQTVSEQPATSGTVDTASALEPSNAIDNTSDEDDDDDDSNSYVSDKPSDKIVNVNVGRPFIEQLDEMFDRRDMDYPDNIKFNISIPTSLLNELNALWIESIMYQLDEYAKKSAEMIKKDEEFARQIALKETELLLADKKPEVPELKEIMDLELATSIYLKDMSKWREKIPTDLAAKMTHEKLFNLFPEIEKDILLEMLMAHDNNFKATVEVLLMSMGRNDLLETENGVDKYVMDKELERQEQLLEEHRKAVVKMEWPLLQDEEISIDTIEGYREEASQHLNYINVNKQKAEEYIRRGMPEVASYFSEVANFHKTKQDQANSMAVASLIQYHSKNNTDSETVDLHYFRVREAREAMDVFIDTHIQKIREVNKPSVMLFFITGRGLHSPGRPRVKPACIRRLRERGLRYAESNPGLLRVRVSCNDKLTFQVT